MDTYDLVVLGAGPARPPELAAHVGRRAIVVEQDRPVASSRRPAVRRPRPCARPRGT